MAKSAISVTGPLIKLSIFAVVTVVFTAVLGISIANINMSKTNEYKAKFSDVTMLLENDDVRIAGVRVGQVTEVEVVDKNVAEVTFQVDAGRDLPRDTQAAVKWRNLVGQRYISLEPDVNSEVNGGDTLPTNGDGVIPLSQTRPAVDLTELFNGFKPLFVALSPKDLNELSYNIIQVLQGEGGTIESLLAHTASLTRSIADKDKVIGEVITNLNSVLDTLNKKSPQLNDTIDTLHRLVKGLAKDVDPIGDALVAIDDLSRTTAGFVKDVRKPLKDDIAKVGETARTLNKHEPIVEHWINYGEEKFTKLGRTGSYGSWLNFYLCRVDVSITALNDSPLVNVGPPPSNAARCKA